MIFMKKKINIALSTILIFSQVLTGCSAQALKDTASDSKSSNAAQSGSTYVPNGTNKSDPVSDSIITNDSEMLYGNAMNESFIAAEDCIDGMPGMLPSPELPNPSTGESYAELKENAFISTATEATSTFSSDVDTAAYSNIRRMIENGYTLSEIPADAVRIEEMINYFSYDYQAPKKDEPFAVTMQSTVCPWNSENNIVRIALNTEKVDFSKAPNSNLVFLLDVSGSMSDSNKLPLLVKAFSLLINELGEKDKVSIVTYAGEDKVVLEGVSCDQKDTILTALENLEASGSTNGSAGIETAYELAQEYFIEGGNNRVILATDGDFNVGITDGDELEEFISKKKETGIFLSTLGFGMGNYRDDYMELLADKGNGNYAYIDDIKEAKKVMVEELGANFNTVAKDVKLQVEFNPEVVEQYRLIGYENRVMANEDFEDDSKDAGEIGSGHAVTALYEITMKDSYEAKTDSEQDNWLTLRVRYKKPEADTSKELSYQAGTEQYLEKPNGDFSFALAVAEFGLLLRNSEWKAEASFNNVIELAKKSNYETDTYKNEFIKLVDKVAYTNQ